MPGRRFEVDAGGHAMSDLRDGSVAVQVFLSAEAYDRLAKSAGREGRRAYQHATELLERLLLDDAEPAPPSKPRRGRSTPTTSERSSHR